MPGVKQELLATLKLEGDSKFSGGLKNAAASAAVLSTAITGASVAVLALAKSTANLRDEQTKAARAAGATTEQFTSLAFAAELSGVNQDLLGQSLARLNAPTALVSKSIEKLGVSLTDATGKAKDQAQLIGEIADGFSNLETPAKKSAAAFEIFGARGTQLVNLLEQGSEGIAKLTEEAKELGIVFDQQAGIQTEIFNDNIAKLQTGIRGLGDTVGQSVIEFINQSGVIEGVTDAVKGAIRFIKSLDNETKEIILTVGAVVATVATVATGLVGLAATIKFVAIPALTAFSGTLGLATGGLTLLVAAITVLAIETKDSWAEITEATEGAADAFAETGSAITETTSDIGKDVSMLATDVFDDLKEVAEDVGKSVATSFENLARKAAPAFDSVAGSVENLTGVSLKAEGAFSFLDKFDGFTENIREFVGLTQAAGRNIDVLGTIAKSTFKVIGAAIAFIISPFRIFVRVIGIAIKGLVQFGEVLRLLANRDFVGARAAADKTIEIFKKVPDAISSEVGKSFDNIKKQFSGGFLVFEKEAEKSAKKIGKAFTNGISSEVEKQKGPKLPPPDIGEFNKAIVQFQKRFTDSKANVIDFEARFKVADALADAKAVANLVSQSASKFSTITGAFSQLAENQNEIVRRQAAEIDRQYTILIKKTEQQFADLIDQTEKAEDARIEAIRNSFDTEIADLKSQEARKLAILEQASAARLLLLDSEFQAEREKVEQQFAALLEQSRLKFEADKLLLEERAIDKEQRQINEQILENEFNESLKRLELEKEKAITDLTKKFSAERKAEIDKTKAAEQKTTADNKAKIEMLEKQKADALTKAEEEKAAKLAQIEADRDAELKKLQKEQIRRSFEAQKAQLENTKALRSAEAFVAGIAAAAQAFAALASIPFVGIALGAAAAATIVAATVQRVALINSQKIPEPAELSFQKGGFVPGNMRERQDGGGVPARLTSGEFVIDRDRSQKMFQAIDDNMQGGNKQININFEEGSIVNQGSIMDEQNLDDFVTLLGERIQREGVIFNG